MTADRIGIKVVALKKVVIPHRKIAYIAFYSVRSDRIIAEYERTRDNINKI